MSITFERQKINEKKSCARRRSLSAAAFLLLSASFCTQAQQTSPYTKTIVSGDTRITCKYTTSGVTVSSVASASGTIDCYIPSGYPGAGSVPTPVDSTLKVKLFRSNTQFTANALAAETTRTTRPQFFRYDEATPPSCHPYVEYSWHAAFVASISVKNPRNSKTVVFPQVTVVGPTKSWFASSVLCNP